MWDVNGSDSSGLDLKNQKRSQSFRGLHWKSFPGLGGCVNATLLCPAPCHEAAAVRGGCLKMALATLLGRSPWHLLHPPVSPWEALRPLLPPTCHPSPTGVTVWEEEWPGWLGAVAAFPEPKSEHALWQGWGAWGAGVAPDQGPQH